MTPEQVRAAMMRNGAKIVKPSGRAKRYHDPIAAKLARLEYRMQWMRKKRLRDNLAIRQDSTPP